MLRLKNRIRTPGDHDVHVVILHERHAWPTASAPEAQPEQ
jgi:hypothetical protein